MEKIKTVGLHSLKKNLTSYLQDVRSGIRILITDHQEWVAELREPDMAYRESVRPMMSIVHDDEDELQLFRSLSKEARVALLSELEKV